MLLIGKSVIVVLCYIMLLIGKSVIVVLYYISWIKLTVSLTESNVKNRYT